MDEQMDVYEFKVLPQDKQTAAYKDEMSEISMIVEKSFYTALKGLMFHQRLSELAITNMLLSSRMVKFALHVIIELKFDIRVLRFEYNGLTVDHLDPLIRYLETDQFSGLDHLSLSGNQIGDEGTRVILSTIINKLDTDIIKYRDRLRYPITHLKLSHCGISNKGLQTLDEYARSLEKIRLSTLSDNRSKYRFEIDLSKNLIGDEGLMKIIDILRAVCAITSLNIDENYLVTPAGMTKFIGCLDFVHSLEQLTLREMCIPRSTIEYLQRFLYRNIYLNKIILSFEKKSIMQLLDTHRSLTKYFRVSNEGSNCLANAMSSAKMNI
jgi:Ran GTPase-activating protein (RanGAP) involved in mRNA processing and transport